MSNARQLLRWVQDNRAATAKRANEATFSSAVHCSILQELEMWDALLKMVGQVDYADRADADRWREIERSICYSFDNTNRTFYLKGDGRKCLAEVIDDRIGTMARMKSPECDVLDDMEDDMQSLMDRDRE